LSVPRNCNWVGARRLEPVKQVLSASQIGPFIGRTEPVVGLGGAYVVWPSVCLCLDK
jgi:hypothetical protein